MEPPPDVVDVVCIACLQFVSICFVTAALLIVVPEFLFNVWCEQNCGKDLSIDVDDGDHPMTDVQHGFHPTPVRIVAWFIARCGWAWCLPCICCWMLSTCCVCVIYVVFVSAARVFA